MSDFSFISLWGLNLEGLIGGAAAFMIIWATRLGCIKGEYYFRRSFRYVFLILGLLGVFCGLFIGQLLLSAICSIFGFACLWGIHEVIEQETRVNKGWYPRRSDKN
jgi:hypothetical protein